MTSTGRLLDTDAVVVGIGAQPRAGLAEQAGLAVAGGVVVDELLRSSDPRVFAAGDVASARHRFHGEQLRVEHWSNAREQGAAAARSMLGAGAPYDVLPYFFSDQYDAGMEYRGRAHAGHRVVFRGDPDSGRFLVFWLRHGRVLAGMNVNVWDVGAQIEAMIRSRATVDVDRLADGDVPLADTAEPRPARAGATVPSDATQGT